MRARPLLITCLAASMTAPCPSVLRGESSGTRPNILWLIAEDFGPHLGCYGTKEVWTPHHRLPGRPVGKMCDCRSK